MVFQGLCGRAVADAPAHIPAAEEAQLLYDAIWRQLQPGMADPRQRGSYPRRRGEPFPYPGRNPRSAKPAPAFRNGS